MPAIRKQTTNRGLQRGISRFVIVDAGMNDLIRPALYQAHHEIVPLRESQRGTIRADVVGPICESGDFLARDRELANVLPGDLLAVCTAGAYGFVAASNYNARPRPPEILVDGPNYRVIRSRESYEDLIRGECAQA
jgi:diaminopimelate decarboxylase